MRSSKSLSLGNPLPVSLPQECRKATKMLQSFVDPVNGLDKVIPINVLKAAQGFAIFTVVKAGFLFSARAGTGVVIARLPTGEWSAPSAIGTAGVGFGGQAGAEITEFILCLNTKAAVKTFMSAGQLSLGGNMSVAVGPLGRNAEGSATLNSKGKAAAIFSYSRTKGIFGGVSVEGSVIVERADANVKAYRQDVKARQLLAGQIETPDFAQGLVDACTVISGKETAWIDESLHSSAQTNDDAGGSTYSFTTPHSSMGSDTNGFINRPRSSSNRSSRLGSSLSKFSPNFGRKDSSNRTRDYIGYDSRDSHSQADDQDAGGGTWAADVKKPAFSGWRDSGASSDEEPPRVSGPAGRARSGTVTPRNKPTTITQPDNPFGSDTFDFSRPADDDIFGDNRGIKLNYNNSSRDGLDEPRRTSMESSHTINSASDSSIDGYGGKGRGSFMFQGNKIKQERAALTQDDFKPAPPARPRTAANSVGAAVALYDFVGQEEGDLSFKKGDRIEILQKPPGEEWWVGKLGLNEGILPKNYVLLDD